MAFTYLSNYPLEEARELFLRKLVEAGLKPRVERIPTSEANGRITSEAVYARICAPHYNACAMDGIALQASQTFGATETTPVRLPEGTFVWVNTGDPLPEGCDAVVMVEDVVQEEGAVVLYEAAVPWQNVRQIGEDISAGDMILPSFSVLTPAAIGALLEAGVLSLEVITQPMVGIIPTGNEIVPPTEDPREGDIIESNSAIFSGMLREWGCEVRVYPPVGDSASGGSGAARNSHQTWQAGYLSLCSICG